MGEYQVVECGGSEIRDAARADSLVWVWTADGFHLEPLKQ